MNGSQDNLLDNEAPMATNDEGDSFHPVDGLGAQTAEEKKFIILVERGDVASIKRYVKIHNRFGFYEVI